MFKPFIIAIVLSATGCSSSPQPPAAPSKPREATVREELEATFAARMRAYEAKDHAALIDQVSPAFSATRPDGTTMTRDDLSGYIQKNLERWVRITRQSNQIEALRLDGDNAIVDVRQNVVRTQIVDGKEAVVESKVLQTETWTKTPTGWKLLAVGNERDSSVYVDGKQFK